MSALQELREALQHAGLKEGSAERIAYALQSRDFVRDNLATKEDLLKIETSLKQDSLSLEMRLKDEIHKLDSKIDKILIDNQKTARSNLSWTFVMFVTFFVGILALIKF